MSSEIGFYSLGPSPAFTDFFTVFWHYLIKVSTKNCTDKSQMLQTHANSSTHAAMNFNLLLLYEPGILRMSTTPTQDTHFCGSVCKTGRIGLPRRVDCLAPMGNHLRVPFPRTQRRNGHCLSLI